jgi:hypothetical protein
MWYSAHCYFFGRCGLVKLLLLILLTQMKKCISFHYIETSILLECIHNRNFHKKLKFIIRKWFVSFSDILYEFFKIRIVKRWHWQFDFQDGQWGYKAQLPKLSLIYAVKNSRQNIFRQNFYFSVKQSCWSINSRFVVRLE